jgi:hypothetical protein
MMLAVAVATKSPMMNWKLQAVALHLQQRLITVPSTMTLRNNTILHEGQPRERHDVHKGQPRKSHDGILLDLPWRRLSALPEDARVLLAEQTQNQVMNFPVTSKI